MQYHTCSHELIVSALAMANLKGYGPHLSIYPVSRTMNAHKCDVL